MAKGDRIELFFAQSTIQVSRGKHFFLIVFHEQNLLLIYTVPVLGIRDTQTGMPAGVNTEHLACPDIGASPFASDMAFLLSLFSSVFKKAPFCQSL